MALGAQHIIEHHVALLLVLVRFEEVILGLLEGVARVQTLV